MLEDLAQSNQVTVLTFPHKKDLRQTDRLGSIQIIRLPYLLRLSKGFISPSSLATFFREAKKHDTIILNCPNFEGFPLALFSRLLGKRILSLFNCQVQMKGGLWPLLLQTGLNLSVYLQLALSDSILTYTRDYFDSIPSLSRFSGKTKFLNPAINNSVPDGKYLRELISMKKNEKWIGFAGRIAREKGIDILIDALKKLSVSDSQLRLIIAGPGEHEVVGENSYHAYIRNLLENSGISYTILGRLTDGQLSAFFKAIDLLVLPSVNRTEAFGIVQVQAMQEGTPVVASNLPGVRTITGTTGMGFCVAPEDSKALSKGITEILTRHKTYANERLVEKSKKAYDMHTTLTRYREAVLGVGKKS